MAQRIGVEVTTEIRGGPTSPGGPAGVFHIVGVTERGAVGEAVAVTSLAEFERRLGGRTPYSGNVYDAARLFFREGGSQLLVSRVVGSGAERAGVDLLSPASGEDDGDAVARVEVAEYGGFANGGAVEVTRVQNAYSVVVTDQDGEVLASVRNVNTLDALVAGARSNPYVNITSLSEQDDLSLATETYSLTGGSDDRENVSGQDLIAALEAGGDAGEGGAVAAPGYPADSIGTSLVAYASRHRKIALLAGHETDSLADVETVAAQLHEEAEGPEYAGVFHPHVQVNDASGARVVPPEAFAAAVRARTFATGAFWSTPAGTVSGRAQWATATVPALSRADIERLDLAHVNGIETSGSRVYLNNWTSLAVDRENLGRLRDADVLNNLAAQIERTLEQYVWEDIDSRGLLHSDIDSAVTAIVSDMAANGGTWARRNDEGEEVDPGYVVSVNPDPGLAAQNKVEVEVGVRLPGTAKLISVGLIKVAIGGDL